MHPSAKYRGGKLKNSFKDEEKYRQKVLKKQKRDTGISPSDKAKIKKPSYDKRESKIWE